MKGCRKMAIFTNQAQLRYGKAVANSNVAVGEILEVLAATKTAVRKTYGQNDRVTYVVSIVNSGNTAMTGLTVADDLGAYAFGTDTLVPLTYVADTVRYYSNGILQTTPAVTAAPPLSVSGISVPAGGNVTIVYEAETNAFAPLLAESEITNTVTISGGGITPVTAKETVIAESGPKLTITKSVSPVPVTENGTLTYTFLIQNTGNTAALAATGAVVTDTFDPVLSNLAVSYNGTAWSDPANYSYNAATGTFATQEGQITVPAATFTQDATTGEWTVTPGAGTLTVTGTI